MGSPGNLEILTTGVRAQTGKAGMVSVPITWAIGSVGPQAPLQSCKSRILYLRILGPLPAYRNEDVGVGA